MNSIDVQNYFWVLPLEFPSYALTEVGSAFIDWFMQLFFSHSQRREARKQEQANNPFYIKASPSSQKVCLPSHHYAVFFHYTEGISVESSLFKTWLV